MTRDERPVDEYSEKHCSHRWPLMVAGLVLPAIIVLSVAWGVVAHFPAVGVIYIPAIVLTGIFRGHRLLLNWPTGIRVDAKGIEIGGVHRKRRLAARSPRRKPPPASYQCYHLFSCPWDAVKNVKVVTDRKQLRALRNIADSAPAGPIKPRGSYVATYYLGMMIPPYMRAALVINVDLNKVSMPTFRDVQALWITTSQHGETSDLWVAPTRHPDQLRRAVEYYKPYQPRLDDW